MFLQAVDRRLEKRESTLRRDVEGEISIQECQRRRREDVELGVYGASIIGEM